MNILVIGGGGREHAIVNCLYNSPGNNKIYISPGNPGIYKLAEKANIIIDNFDDIKDFCRINKIDLLVVGPEQPLADGIKDVFLYEETVVFGPDKFASQLESSKNFAKKIMYEYGIPTANYKTFFPNMISEAREYLNNHSLPIVLKADGLAAGKGVIIAESHNEAIDALNLIFDGEFGAAGSKVVIEEFMNGEEASIFAICDGNDFITLPAAQDHKRIGDGDTGKNTGGMGAYSPAPIISEAILKVVEKDIIVPLLKAMRDKGHPFIGCLYCGLMINNFKPKIVEFNVRFGDPETQAVLPLFNGDFARLLLSAAKGELDKSTIIKTNTKHSACVIMASDGYPDKFEKGFEITGLDKENNNEIFIFHSGTKEENNKIITSGGRVLGITAVCNSLEESLKTVYSEIPKIKFQNMYFRKDIGQKGLK